ncbi:MetQ/NlpA family ABC transporter substrate-binding protein [Arthrobacter halodurans]|uniref:MetQ/NlpA family ABC transporter substrate-binding protein n=1 Tax=Arthrobacter halodurans TaxID=516699 RepID=A0ABV4UQK5_9MICC
MKTTAPRSAARRSGTARLAAVAAAALAATQLAGCGLVGGSAGAEAGGDKTITLIATESAPFQEPLRIAAESLAEDGWTLETKFVTDIVQPNIAVANGEFDASFFQHVAYLKQFNEDNNLDNEASFYVYGSPAGIYSATHDDIDDLPDGAKIALPVDPANNGRALKLLDRAGKLEVAEGKPVTHISQKDILDNPHGYTFVEVDQQSLATTLPDVDAGFLFTRLAGELGLTTEQALLFEEDDEQLPYRVVVSGKPGFKDSEKGEALRSALQSDEVREWFEGYIGGALTTPWDSTPAEDLPKWAGGE